MSLTNTELLATIVLMPEWGAAVKKKVVVRREFIKGLRAKRSWTQEQLADFAGLHARTIQRIENDGIASLKSLNALAKALGVKASTLELTNTEVDFKPALVELRILRSAVFRKLAPTTSQGLPRLY